MSFGHSPAAWRLTVRAGGCALAAAALALGAGQASQAATAPPAGWHSFDPGTGAGTLFGLYAPSSSDAWAVGETSSGSPVYEHFDGTGWSAAAGPAIGPVYAIDGTSDSDQWVLSADSSAHYNGSSWTTYSLNIPSGMTGLGVLFPTGINHVFAAGPTDAYAEVFVSTDTGVQGAILEHFNGTAWSVVTDAPNITEDGTTVFNSVTGSGPDDVYVSAEYESGASDKAEVLHYNGTAWSAESLPGTPFDVSVDVTGPGTALALGYDSNGNPYAAQLSGGAWTQVSMPAAGLEPVGGGAAGTGTVWAEMVPQGSDTGFTLWQWSGGKWTQIQPDNTDNGTLVGAADGSGLWSFTFGPASDFGDTTSSETELFVG